MVETMSLDDAIEHLEKKIPAIESTTVGKSMSSLENG